MYAARALCLLFLICFFLPKGHCLLPADPCSVSLEFDFMMTKVFLENTNFVSSNEGTPNTPVGYDTQNVPGYRPHYRGEIGYTFCNGDQLSIAGGYYKTSSVAKAATPPGTGVLSDSFILPTQGIAFPLVNAGALLSAASRIDFQFYNIELLYRKSLFCSCPFYFGFFAGLQFADVKYEEEIDYSAFGPLGLNTTNFRNLSRFSGVGPELGAEWDWKCLHSQMGYLTIRAIASSSLLASYTKARHVGGYLFTAGAPNQFVNLKRGTWTWNPVWFGRIGANYLFRCFTCFSPSLEIGLMAANYYHAVEKFFFAGGNDSVYPNTAQYSNVGFFSPYVSVQISF